MYLIMLGAPGTGKGTISKILSEDLKLTHISTGDIFREQISKKTELGSKIEDYLQKGKLVPDELVIETVEARLNEADVKEGAILDGYPRTVSQAEALKSFLDKKDANIKRVAIELNVPDEEIITRITNRATCSNKSCGAIYNLVTRPPKREGICDICGSKLTKRNDDNEDTIKTRLEVYHENSKDLLEFYKENNALYSIHPKDLEETVTNIKEHLENL